MWNLVFKGFIIIKFLINYYSVQIYYLQLPYHLLFSITIYHLLYKNFLPSLSEYTTRTTTLMLRQAIYYGLLASSGGTQSGNHRCSLYYDVFCLYSTTAHLVLISYPGRVYFSCSQHLHRTGSSYQCIKTDPALLIKISVILVF